MRFHQVKHLWSTTALLVVIALILTSCGGGDQQPAPTPPVSPTAEASPTAPLLPTTPIATPHGTSVPTDEATPISAIDLKVCDDGCILRAPRTPVVEQLLTSYGDRASYQSDAWLWFVTDTPVATALHEQEVSLYLVQDSPETLYLYGIRQRDSSGLDHHVAGLGDILDYINGLAVVRVPSVPAAVTGVTDLGIWVEKFAPGAPSPDEMRPPGQDGALKDQDLGVLLDDVDPVEYEARLVEFAGMSSTDGSGVGTRQYGTTGNVMTAELLYTQLEKWGLQVHYQDFLTPEGFLSSNVIGQLAGDDPSMIYGVMAHLDSTSTNFGEAPGTDDNATGMSGALTIAEIVSQYRLAHTLEITFVNAEETMIIGSMAYAAEIVQNSRPIEGVFNMDTIGTVTMGNRLILNAGPRSAWMSDLMVRMNNEFGFNNTIRSLQTETIVSDDTMLRRQEIESVLVTRLLADEYTVHHSPNDVLDAMSVDYALSATRLVMVSVGGLVRQSQKSAAIEALPIAWSEPAQTIARGRSRLAI